MVCGSQEKTAEESKQFVVASAYMGVIVGAAAEKQCLESCWETKNHREIFLSRYKLKRKVGLDGVWNS